MSCPSQTRRVAHRIHLEYMSILDILFRMKDKVEIVQNLNNLQRTSGSRSSGSSYRGTMKKRNKGNRGQGTCSISVNPSGTARAQICLPGGDRLTRSFYTKKEAQHWLDEQFQVVQSGLTSDNRKITVREFAEHWLGAKKTSLRPTFWRNYSIYISCPLKWLKITSSLFSW